MSSDSLLCRILLDLKPKTKSIESITFDLPLPLGPTTDDMFLSNGPISCLPAYDLKFSRTMRWIIRRGCAVGAAATSDGATSGAGSSIASIIVSSAGRQVLERSHTKSVAGGNIFTGRCHGTFLRRTVGQPGG